ncbi:MAG: hypothetical protein EHM45_11480 [Desulfobacteraceae bacterium]|nr:MAG: hypothetical protein EHM45_11480 [Desulfobacteraceae bacterium]
MLKKRFFIGSGLLIFTIFYVFSSLSDPQVVSSRAYSGHTNDADANHFVQTFQKTVGTRLDDCQTCHRAGVAGTDTEKEYNACGYCHLREFPNPKYKTGVPKNFEETLNAFGLAYKKAGRNAAALRAIAEQDADGDGYSNLKEIEALRYPGDPSSKPGQILAPVYTFSFDRIKALPMHEQFLLMNATKQKNDEYAFYKGVLVKDLLAAAGITPAGAAGITVFAPDGFSVDYSMEEILKPFPKGFFYLEPKSIKDPEAQFTVYPNRLPQGIADKSEIANPLWLQVAYLRDGQDLSKAFYEKGTGMLQGEGPFRLITPQRNVTGDPTKPGRPDRSIKSKVYGDGWDYRNDIDHNAGNAVRGMCVIRINPMPAGYEEYDWKNGWSLIDERKIIIYGYGVNPYK